MDASNNNNSSDQSKISGIIDHKSEGQYTNNHLLHVKTGAATEDDLRAILRKAISEGMKIAKQINSNPVDGRFKINIVSTRDGSTFGYAYVWIVSVEIFNMLIGKNPDGSERFELIEDPDWVPPSSESSNWADIIDLESPPKIRKRIEPLINISPFECGPTFVSEPSPEFQPNVLCGKGIPTDITAEDLKILFQPFVSDSSKKFVRKIKGVVNVESYPLVNLISAKRIVYITFDLSSHDACFALKMARKILINKAGKSYTLIFNRAYKNKDKVLVRSEGSLEYFDS